MLLGEHSTSARIFRTTDERESRNALVQNVELLGRGILLKQLRRHLALSGQDDAILGEDADGCAGVGDGLEGIFDLVEAAFGGEDGCLGEK